MAEITWDETVPTGASNASEADDAFRSLTSSIAVGLGESFYWPGSAASQGASTASSGEQIPGSARVAVGATAPTGGHPNGFLALDANNEQIWHVGSAWTDVLAHGRMQDRNGGVGDAPFTTRWLLSTGTIRSLDRTDEVTFATAYNGIPTVMLGPGQGAALWDIGLKNVSPSGFTVNKRFRRSGASTVASVFWRSEGTVTI